MRLQHSGGRSRPLLELHPGGKVCVCWWLWTAQLVLRSSEWTQSAGDVYRLYCLGHKGAPYGIRELALQLQHYENISILKAKPGYISSADSPQTPRGVLCARPRIHCPPKLQDQHNLEETPASTFTKFTIKKCSDLSWHSNIICFNYYSVFCHKCHPYSVSLPPNIPWSVRHTEGYSTSYYRQLVHLFCVPHLYHFKNKEIFPKNVGWQGSNVAKK